MVFQLKCRSIDYSTEENVWVAVIDWNEIREQENLAVEDDVKVMV